MFWVEEAKKKKIVNFSEEEKGSNGNDVKIAEWGSLDTLSSIKATRKTSKTCQSQCFQNSGY